jgi:hypothetical protein
MIRTTDEWEALELATAARLTSFRERLPAAAAGTSFAVALGLFSWYWSPMFAFLWRLLL